MTVNINGCTFDPSPALFCISTDIYKAAHFQAEELIRAIGGAGPIALPASQLTDPNAQLRLQAVKDAVAATGGKVTLAQVVADIDTPQLSPPAVNALLAARGGTLAGAMSTSYDPSIAMAVALTDNPPVTPHQVHRRGRHRGPDERAPRQLRPARRAAQRRQPAEDQRRQVAGQRCGRADDRRAQHRGDVRAKEDMYALIGEPKARGKAVLVISSDLPEIVRISDRIVVMSRRRIVFEAPNSRRYDEMSEAVVHSVV